MDNDETILLAAANGQEKYDEVIDKLFSNPKIVAPILHLLIPEYKNISVEDIIRSIQSISNTEAVDDISRAAVESSEQKAITEKTIRFDKLLKLGNPDLSIPDTDVYMYVDLEMQNKGKERSLGYPLTKRAVYYVARSLSRQLGILKTDTNYGKLRKCYSIWICTDVLAEEKDSIVRFSFNRDVLYGTPKDKTCDYDLMEVIIVRRGREETDDNGILDYLNGLFTSNVGRMNRYVNIRQDQTLLQEVKKMTGFGAALVEKGEIKGEAKLAKLMKLLLSEGRNDDALKASTDEEARKQLYREKGISD